MFGPNSIDDFSITGNSHCPVEVKLLGVLRILGRDWCFDDIAEATGMSETTAREKFHLFNENFVESYYGTFVYRQSGEKLEKAMSACLRQNGDARMHWVYRLCSCEMG